MASAYPAARPNPRTARASRWGHRWPVWPPCERSMSSPRVARASLHAAVQERAGAVVEGEGVAVVPGRHRVLVAGEVEAAEQAPGLVGAIPHVGDRSIEHEAVDSHAQIGGPPIEGGEVPGEG